MTNRCFILNGVIDRPERRYYEEEDLDPFDGIMHAPEDEEDIEEEYDDEEERSRRIQELQDEVRS